ncbi:MULTISPECIES: hypothetical protein [Pseudomonas]|uniref:Uncharacterized protein n=1 Tax=Pseudomonas glycinae TaxID=1785145 RepID=A0ABM5ZLI3_9PSED|nr:MULTISPECIES: hypothetical protein [Pseudomonas]AMQ83354.1 hypothetical protein AWU82_08560 [Pseudomonas glycinae]NKF27244.1 hypothetical protein [Pseudomonas sp. BG5]
MNDSGNKPKIFFTPGSNICVIVLEDQKRKLMEGKIKSIDKELGTLDLTLKTTNTPWTVKLESIEYVLLDEKFKALMFRKLSTDKNVDSLMDDLVDVENAPPKPPQAPQRLLTVRYDMNELLTIESVSFSANLDDVISHAQSMQESDLLLAAR